MKTKLFLPVVALLFGALVLGRGMGSDPLWADEGWSLYASQRPSLSAFYDFLKPDLHPPLYFFLLRGWDDLVGAHPLGLRALSFWSALLAVALSYRLGGVLFGRRAALAAALLVGSSDLVYSLTPVVRNYSPYMLLATLCSLAYWRRWAVVYVLGGAALLYTHYWGGFILLAHGVHALVYRPRFAPRLAVWGLLIGLFFAPWLPVLAQQIQGGGTLESSTGAGGYSVALELDIPAMQVLFFQLFGVPEVFFVGMALVGMAGLGRRGLPDEKTMLAGLWLLLPVLLPILSGLAGYKLLTHRPMIALVPAVALLVGHFLARLPSWAWRSLLFIILANNLLTTGATPAERGDWWRVGDVLAGLLAPQDALFIESDIYAYTIAQHAQLAHTPYARLIYGRQTRGGEAGHPAPPVNDLLHGFDTVWLVEFTDKYTMRGDLDLLGYAPTTPPLNLGYFLVDDITLTRFARPTSAAPAWSFGDLFGLVEVQSWAAGDALHVDLLWRALQAPTQDYTVSVFLLDEGGRVVAQHDSFPLNGFAPTTSWQPDHLYFDRHTLRGVPAAGDFRLGVRVYTWWDLASLPAAPCAETCDFVVVN